MNVSSLFSFEKALTPVKKQGYKLVVANSVAYQEEEYRNVVEITLGDPYYQDGGKVNISLDNNENYFISLIENQELIVSIYTALRVNDTGRRFDLLPVAKIISVVKFLVLNSEIDGVLDLSISSNKTKTYPDESIAVTELKFRFKTYESWESEPKIVKPEFEIEV